MYYLSPFPHLLMNKSPQMQAFWYILFTFITPLPGSGNWQIYSELMNEITKHQLCALYSILY